MADLNSHSRRDCHNVRCSKGVEHILATLLPLLSKKEYRRLFRQIWLKQNLFVRNKGLFYKQVTKHYRNWANVLDHYEELSAKLFFGLITVVFSSPLRFNIFLEQLFEKAMRDSSLKEASFSITFVLFVSLIRCLGLLLSGKWYM